MGAMFIGQQYLQNVLEYSTLDAGAAIIPAAIGMVARGAPLGEADRVARLALHAAVRLLSSACSASSACSCSGTRAPRTGRSASPTCWSASASGFAGTPASHSLTGSVPVRRAGMASGTSDLQRDLGGAIMQSILGAVLTAGYAASISAAIASSPDKDKITDNVQAELQKSFSSASEVAEQYPQLLEADHRRRPRVVPRRRPSRLHRRDRRDPDRRRDRPLPLPAPGARRPSLLAQYAAEDAGRVTA